MDNLIPFTSRRRLTLANISEEKGFSSLKKINLTTNEKHTQAKAPLVIQKSRRQSLTAPTLSRIDVFENKFLRTKRQKQHGVSLTQRRASLLLYFEDSNQIEEEEEIEETVRTESLLQVFYRVIKLVRTLCRVSLVVRKYAVTKNDSNVVSDLQNFLQDCITNSRSKTESRAQFEFDKSAFLVEENHRLPFWARLVCEQMPEYRSKESLKKLRRYLRGIPLFSKFSELAQIELCRHAIYNRYDHLRILLSQGDEAEYFYLILHGDVTANIARRDINTGIEVSQTIDTLRECDSFGATGLIYNTRRTATVIASSRHVEVIMFDKDTFNHFCKPLIMKIHQDQTNFLETHSSFESWPQQKVNLISYDAKSKYIRQGKIIDFDLARSRYIYFIMEGSVDVLYHKPSDKPGWIHSKKLNKHVGILAGNRIYAPNVCNLPNSLKTDTKVNTILLSNGVTLLYIPKMRYLDLKPNIQKQLSFYALSNNQSHFQEMNETEYDNECNRGKKWIEYRQEIFKEKIKHLTFQDDATFKLPRLKAI